jgi:hypothetical protein
MKAGQKYSSMTAGMAKNEYELEDGSVYYGDESVITELHGCMLPWPQDSKIKKMSSSVPCTDDDTATSDVFACVKTIVAER